MITGRLLLFFWLPTSLKYTASYNVSGKSGTGTNTSGVKWTPQKMYERTTLNIGSKSDVQTESMDNPDYVQSAYTPRTLHKIIHKLRRPHTRKKKDQFEKKYYVVNRKQQHTQEGTPEIT